MIRQPEVNKLLLRGAGMRMRMWIAVGIVLVSFYLALGITSLSECAKEHTAINCLLNKTL